MTMKNKTIVRLIVAVLLACFCFAGCEKGPPADNSQVKEPGAPPPPGGVTPPQAGGG
jgi:hypothetical protein